MKIFLLMLTVLSVLVLAACSVPATPVRVPTLPSNVLATQPPSILATMPASPLSPTNGQNAAIVNSRQALAEQLNVDPNTIAIVSVEAVEWSNGCLGIQTPGMMCTMMITPGYRVILEVDGKQYEYHTNQTGDVVRLAPGKP